MLAKVVIAKCSPATASSVGVSAMNVPSDNIHTNLEFERSLTTKTVSPMRWGTDFGEVPGGRSADSLRASQGTPWRWNGSSLAAREGGATTKVAVNGVVELRSGCYLTCEPDLLLREPAGQTPLHGLVSSVPDILPEVAPPQCSHTTRPPIHRAA